MTVRIIFTCDACGNQADSYGTQAPEGWTAAELPSGSIEHRCPLDHTETDHIDFVVGGTTWRDGAHLCATIHIPIDQPGMTAIAATGLCLDDWHLTRKDTPMTQPPRLETLHHDEDSCRMAHGGTHCDCHPSTEAFNGLVEALNALASLVYTVKDGLFIIAHKDTP